MEAYLVSPSKIAESYPEQQEVTVKIACLPSSAHDSICVPVTEVYPTQRQLKTVKDGKIIPVTIGDMKMRPKAKRIGKRTFEKLEFEMPRSKWTLYELLAMIGSDNAVQLMLKAQLTEQGRKHCLITSKKQTAYRLGKVISINSTVSTPVKEDNLLDLEKEYSTCTACELGDIRLDRGANLVFGRGNPNALGMIIAESPWILEERDKKPLHPEAPAGGVLHRVMSKVQLKQSDWYLTNSVICRPLLDKDGPLSKNKPKKIHLEACSTRLKRTLRTVSPKLVILLGAHAYEAWFGYPPEGGVKRNMGWVTVHDDETRTPVNYLVFFTYHPSYIARREGTDGERESQLLYLEHWKNIAKVYRQLTNEI